MELKLSFILNFHHIIQYVYLFMIFSIPGAIGAPLRVDHGVHLPALRTHRCLGRGPSRHPDSGLVALRLPGMPRSDF